MYEPVLEQHLLRKLRQRIARVALNFPTDPFNLAVKAVVRHPGAFLEQIGRAEH